MQTEKWKLLSFTNDKYKISNYGRIISYCKNENGILLKPSKDNLGYFRIGLECNNERKNFLVHRLVAAMFVPNPYFYTEINHIDGNKENNYFENLEWCTRSHNVQHAFDMGLKVNRKGANHPRSKEFYQFDLNGNLIRSWVGVNECARNLVKTNATKEELHSVRANLTACLNNRHKTLLGYIFSFKKEVDPYEHIPDGSKNPIIAIDKNTGETLEFLNFHEAERTVLPNGKKPIATIICKVCKGKRESHAGYFWKYKNQE